MSVEHVSGTGGEVAVGCVTGAIHGSAKGDAVELCAEYERQLGGGSPLSSLMTAKD
jgi:hypothetical protein